MWFRLRVLGGALALLVSITPTVADAGVARLRRLVVVGDSILAGFSSGGLVDTGRGGQQKSAPAILARRARVALRQPLMTPPGVPPQLVIVDDNHNGSLDPGEVRRTRSSLGFRDDTDNRARNLAVPGEDMGSVFDSVSPQNVLGDIITGDANGRDILKFLILGLPLQRDAVSQISRARDLHPTFLMVWIGNNDILDMATNTDPNAAKRTASDFGARVRMLLSSLASTGADMAVANLPDPTGIAALRHAATAVTSCQTAGGTTEVVAADDLLSIDLPRSQLPVPSCAKVLNTTERAQIRATVQAFNAEIGAAIAETEQAHGVGIAAVDMFTAFDQLAATGVDLNADGVADLTTRYLGGIFSLDGIHPTWTGNVLVANSFIDAIDARFGESIPRVDVARVAVRDPLAHSRFRPAGEAPFGLIGADDDDAVESFFDKTFTRIEDGADSLRRRFLDLRRRILRLF